MFVLKCLRDFWLGHFTYIYLIFYITLTRWKTFYKLNQYYLTKIIQHFTAVLYLIFIRMITFEQSTSCMEKNTHKIGSLRVSLSDIVNRARRLYGWSRVELREKKWCTLCKRHFYPFPKQTWKIGTQIHWSCLYCFTIYYKLFNPRILFIFFLSISNMKIYTYTYCSLFYTTVNKIQTNIPP